ncbi:beta-glucosidase [Streptomyces sp. KR80]|uniref:beta-glucosidase n=1 Tax=Streptomyces sp. KR80 TaxID=3457426 RepID=UPI003FD439A4
MSTRHISVIAAAVAAALAAAALVSPAGATPAAPPGPVDRAKAIVAQMTLDEKISQLHGIRDDEKDIYRHVPAIPRLGIPAFLPTNGPAGVSTGGSRRPENQPFATALPAPVALAASFDVTMAERYGSLAGKETLHVGRNFMQGPTVNIHRTPYGGRNFESYGEDPYLAGKIAAANIQGTQKHGVPANVKHYVANNQEIDRFHVNELIDERTLREIYLPPYEAAVKEGKVASAMCSYPRINGVFACENPAVLDVAKKDWKWDGFYTPDYGAVHSTVASANAGLDLELPTGKYFGSALKQAVLDGDVSMATIDDKLVRRFAKMIEYGLFDREPTKTPIPAQKHGTESRYLAQQGMVLLKNSDSVLPLDAKQLKSIALIGPYAGAAVTGGTGSSKVRPLYTVTPQDGLQKRAGADVTVSYTDGKDTAAAAEAAKAADVAIVMVGEISGEGESHERTTMALGGNQDALVEAVSAANRKTIVVLKSGGPVLMPWLEDVPAVLQAWYPGEEDGNAVAGVLFGDVNPSGKLPMTFPKRAADLPTNTPEQYPGVKGPDGHYTAEYSEGVFVGYRHYDQNRIEPLFPFGHGLAYTTYTYKNLNITSGDAGQVVVESDITNTGRRSGSETVQLYVGAPAATPVPIPPQQLKGIQKVRVAPGQTRHVSFRLTQRSFSYWDVTSHRWKVAGGRYPILLGSSSRDIRLRDSIAIPAH